MNVEHGTPKAPRDGARDQIGDLLRSALPSAEDAPIDDATRRLMLQLSIEPVDGLAQRQPEETVPRKRSLFRRVLRPQANSAG